MKGHAAIPMSRDRVDLDIAFERAKQEAKWGTQNHDPFKYLAILMEEVGEASQAAVDWYRWDKNEFQENKLRQDHFRGEMVQVAAVAKAIIECIDRGTWKRQSNSHDHSPPPPRSGAF